MDNTLTDKNGSIDTLMHVLGSEEAASIDDNVIIKNNPEKINNANSIESVCDNNDELFPDFKKTTADPTSR